MKLVGQNAKLEQKVESLPVRGAWVEMLAYSGTIGSAWSLPVRGAWVEMPENLKALGDVVVAPRAGSVG